MENIRINFNNLFGISFPEAGVELDWQGEGVNEKGIVKSLNKEKFQSLIAHSFQRTDKNQNNDCCSLTAENLTLTADNLTLNAEIVSIDPKLLPPTCLGAVVL